MYYIPPERRKPTLENYVRENLMYALSGLATGVLIGIPLYFASKHQPMYYPTLAALCSFSGTLGAVNFKGQRKTHLGEENFVNRVEEGGFWYYDW